MPVAVTCRVFKVSRSGFFQWRGRGHSARHVDDPHLSNTTVGAHAASGFSYGAPRGCAKLAMSLVGRGCDMTAANATTSIHDRRHPAPWRGHGPANTAY